MRDAEHLAQTPATVEWLKSELRREYDLQDVVQDNYRFAVALALVTANPELLIPVHKEILRLPAFPEELQKSLEDRLRFHLTEWEELWLELEQLGRDMMAREETTMEDTRFADRLVGAVGRHVRKGEKVIRALDGKVADSKRELMEWLQPELVDVAGRMRLRKAIPRIIRRIPQEDAAVVDQCGTALGRIGIDAVVDEIACNWRRFDTDPRLSFCEAMNAIHTDNCIGRCLEFLEEEEDVDVAVWLANVLLSHFCTEGIESGCELVVEGDPEELMPDLRDLKFRIVAVATAMDVGFPDYEKWHQEARESHYGWFDHKRGRISQNF